jgi:hypothetical protein
METHKHRKMSSYIVGLAIGFASSLYLGYIDEGKYSFEFLTDAGNWIAVGMYTALLSGIYLLIIAGLMKLMRLHRNSKQNRMAH